MTNNLRNRLLAAVVIGGLGALAAAPASANGFGHGHLYGFNLGSVYGGLEHRVPYFAAHPPVYYSYPIPRTYGYTPFAYPPTVRTPDISLASSPQTIVNPYVNTSGDEPA